MVLDHLWTSHTASAFQLDFPAIFGGFTGKSQPFFGARGRCASRCCPGAVCWRKIWCRCPIRLPPCWTATSACTESNSCWPVRWDAKGRSFVSPSAHGKHVEICWNPMKSPLFEAKLHFGTQEPCGWVWKLGCSPTKKDGEIWESDDQPVFFFFFVCPMVFRDIFLWPKRLPSAGWWDNLAEKRWQRGGDFYGDLPWVHGDIRGIFSWGPMRTYEPSRYLGDSLWDTTG